ncbi:MAG: uracil-DNA glycosylase [Candidatus Baumannia cicadellinicola]|nr:uracil-DNA glycosylase [Candidatus Baumannia cicadellinicola]MBS0032524.1 uracil-DNA glycosylase [Candidatus Baumannia cicadellinicola]MCJ7461954.1 uracil-DNA glycosylase [Candidatus Baumannia cicadellinicola]MCJ7462698.1 uracil-DNA glycosylase [Candidatus Baumannia cicadellinicola]
MAPNMTWQLTIAQEKKQPYFQQILCFLNKERAAGVTIYPPQKDIFNAFSLTELCAVKVVIIGQDPYHGPNQADGLSFSVRPGLPIPPSLMNIYKELANDISSFIIPQHGCLWSWAEQGIMLLNTVLTVEAGKAYSHANLGWEIFTNKVITLINNLSEGIIFLLWGTKAQKKAQIIDVKRHHILMASHPSPLSAYLSFFGCRHFSKVNILLKQQGKTPIDWAPKLPY